MCGICIFAGRCFWLTLVHPYSHPIHSSSSGFYNKIQNYWKSSFVLHWIYFSDRAFFAGHSSWEKEALKIAKIAIFQFCSDSEQGNNLGGSPVWSNSTMPSLLVTVRLILGWSVMAKVFIFPYKQQKIPPTYG